MSGRAFFSKTLGQDHLCIQDYVEGTPLCGLYAWDPRIKLPLLVLAVGLNVVIAHLSLSVALFVISLGLAIWSRRI